MRDMTCLFRDPYTGCCEGDGEPCPEVAVEFALRFGDVIDCVEPCPDIADLISRGEVEESFAFLRNEPPPRRFIVEEA